MGSLYSWAQPNNSAIFVAFERKYITSSPELLHIIL